MEADRGAAFGGDTRLGQGSNRVAELVTLRVRLARAMDRQVQHIRKRIDDRHANAMQTAGDFVGAVIELTAGMQHGHDDFGR